MESHGRKRVGGAVFALLGCLGAAAVGCGAGAHPRLEDPTGRAERQGAPTQAGQAQQARVEAHRLLGERFEPSRIERAIAAWQRILEGAPGDREALLELSRAEYFAGRVALRAPSPREDTSVPLGAAVEHFERGARFAESSLGAGSSALSLPRAEERLDELFGPDAAAGLYWFAQNRLERARTTGYAELAAEADSAVLALGFCQRHLPQYDDGGPDRELGAFYAAPPASAHRDLSRSRDHFERALGAAPERLATRLRYAQTYAVAAQDHDTFERQLQHVLNDPVGEDPQLAAENRLTQDEAQLLMTAAPDLFE